jgi:uncharacterized protein (TIRG00374 family)
MRRKIIIGLLVSAVFLFLAFRNVKLAELADGLKRTNYTSLVPAAMLMVVSLLFRALRWKYLLLSLKRVGFPNLFIATSIGMMANNVLPARMGEFVRAYLIGVWEGISKSASFATVVVERIFDGMIILGFLAAIVLFKSLSLPDWLGHIVAGTLVLYGFSIAFLLLMWFRKERALAIVSFVTRSFSDRARRSVFKVIDSFIDGLQIVESFPKLILAGVLSVLVWLPNAIVTHIILRSTGIVLPFHAAVLLLVILCIGVMIPSAPGFAGTIQYFCVLGLSIYAVAANEALSFSLVYHASVFIPLTGMGILCLMWKGMSLRELRRKVESEADE